MRDLIKGFWGGVLAGILIAGIILGGFFYKNVREASALAAQDDKAVTLFKSKYGDVPFKAQRMSGTTVYSFTWGQDFENSVLRVGDAWIEIQRVK